MSAASLQTMLSAIYPFLHAGKDYTLNADGTQVLTWAPVTQKGVPMPNLGALPATYAAGEAAQTQRAKVRAATAALRAFWASLTPQQQKPLLVQKATLTPLETDTTAKALLVADLVNSVTGLTPAQEALKNTVLTTCEPLAPEASASEIETTKMLFWRHV